MYDFQKIDHVQPELIRCLRQPGELRISKGACARQYVLAHKKSARNGAGAFGNAKMWSLEACRTCPTGRHYSETVDIKKRSSRRPVG